jgi:hypothetical protein
VCYIEQEHNNSSLANTDRKDTSKIEKFLSNEEKKNTRKAQQKNFLIFQTSGEVEAAINNSNG